MTQGTHSTNDGSKIFWCYQLDLGSAFAKMQEARHHVSCIERARQRDQVTEGVEALGGKDTEDITPLTSVSYFDLVLGSSDTSPIYKYRR